MNRELNDWDDSVPPSDDRPGCVAPVLAFIAVVELCVMTWVLVLWSIGAL